MKQRKRLPPAAVIEIKRGEWAVVDDNGDVLVRGLSNIEAWRWFDRHSGEPIRSSETWNDIDRWPN